MAMVVGIFFSVSAMAVTPYDPNAIKSIPELGDGSGHTLTSVRDVGNEIEITLTNVRTGPIGKDTKGEDLQPAKVIALYSGIMDAKGVKEPFVIARVVNGTAVFRIPNSAIIAGVDVAESIWGRNEDSTRALIHDPKDSWVIAYDDDLEQLAIWILMKANGPTVPARTVFGNRPV